MPGCPCADPSKTNGIMENGNCYLGFSLGLGVYKENGKENGHYYLVFRVHHGFVGPSQKLRIQGLRLRRYVGF